MFQSVVGDRYSTASPSGSDYAPYRGEWLTLEFAGLGELISSFDSAYAIVRQELIAVMEDTSAEGVRLTVQNLIPLRAPFGSQALERSVRVIPARVQGDTISGGYGAFIHYAYWVEHGRGPIRPVRARVLSWIDRYSGERKYAMYVGPARPRPFLKPTIPGMSEYGNRRAAQAAAAITAYIAGYGGMSRGQRKTRL